MIGLLLLYMVWKRHSTLAYDYNRQPRWVFGFLGIVTYIFGIFLFQFCAGVYLALTGNIALLESGSLELILSILSIPFGILLTTIQFNLLKRHWKKNPKAADELQSELLDETSTTTGKTDF